MMELALYSLAGLAVANAASVPISGARTHIHQLLTRQALSSGGFDTNTVSAQCQASCNTYTSIIFSCFSSTLASCGCSIATEQDLVTCLSCETDAADAAGIELGQGLVDDFVNECDTAGVKLPAATVSGGVAGTPTATPNGGNDHSATVTGLSPTTSHDAGDNHGGSSGNSGNGSSNPSPTPGAAGGSNSGNSSSSNSSGGSGTTNPLAASVGLALIGLFFTLAA